MNRAVAWSQYFGAQELANVFEGIATLRRTSSAMTRYLPLMMQDVERVADTAATQDISNIVWAMGVARLPA
eukprot:238402-Alexandrium_andersonii.AAC.1